MFEKYGFPQNIFKIKLILETAAEVEEFIFCHGFLQFINDSWIKFSSAKI